MNSRSKRSIRVSRFPGCSVYCLSSTIGQQVCCPSEVSDCSEVSWLDLVISGLCGSVVENVVIMSRIRESSPKFRFAGVMDEPSNPGYAGAVQPLGPGLH